MLDRYRYYRGPAWQATHGLGPPPESEAADEPERRGEVEDWSAFRRYVKELPVVEGEVLSLAFYHGQSQGQIAALLHVTPRTVRHRRQSALRHLHARLAAE